MNSWSSKERCGSFPTALSSISKTLSEGCLKALQHALFVCSCVNNDSGAYFVSDGLPGISFGISHLFMTFLTKLEISFARASISCQHSKALTNLFVILRSTILVMRIRRRIGSCLLFVIARNVGFKGLSPRSPYLDLCSPPGSANIVRSLHR